VQHQHQEFAPLIDDDATKKPQFSVQEIPVPRKQRKRRKADYFTIFLAVAVWTTLTLSCVVLLFFTYSASASNSDGGTGITGTEIGSVIMLSSAPLLIATVLNEVLVERCWRRVVYAALGDAASFTDVQMGVHLRAANFEWLNIMKRLWTHELSWWDFRSMASYGLLRWGTAISIASVQLCVSWIKTDVMDVKDNNNMYAANKRPLWLLMPVCLHAASIFGTTTLWLLAPWAMFSSRYDERGLLERYQPYLKRVSNGSIAKYETVARSLNPDGHRTDPLEKKHRPGFQFAAKLKGTWFGLLLMALAPGAALLYTWKTQQHGEGMIRSGVYRFGFHLVFLAQNIFYILALDFTVWNLTLEGLCKGPRTKPNKSLRHLGYSSGLMLLWRAFRQHRRPLRAAIFMWMFWFQAVLIRSMTVLYAFIVVFYRYGTREERQDFFDPYFWIGYMMISAVLVLPLFLLWLFTKFQAPMGEQDGWRWAKLAQSALREDGNYGVHNGEAAWGMHVQPFKSVGDTTLR
jgi:hypothetical protein